MHADALQGCVIQNNPARVGEDEEPEKDVDAGEQQPVEPFRKNLSTSSIFL